MKRYVLKIFIFIFINLIFGISILALTNGNHDYKNWNTDSNLSIIESNKKYKFVVMGNSHGRIFSRGENHNAVREILSSDFLNISRSGGGGLLPNLIYLSYFYEKGNSAEKIIYFLDPYIFFSEIWNEKRYFASDEPFKFDFLLELVRYGVSYRSIINYLKSKYSIDWFLRDYEMYDNQEKSLHRVDKDAVRKRVESLYPDGLNKNAFRKYSSMFNELLDLAKKNNSEIIFLFPSTLLGELPGHDLVKNMLERKKLTYCFTYYDFSDAVPYPEMFYNHDHLNPEGIRYFTSNYLKNILG